MSNWTTSKLSDVIEIIGGGTPKRSENKYWNGDIPWLSVADFNNDFRYVNDSIEHITELGLQKSSTKLLDKDHLIISARGTVGCLAQLSVPMAFNQSCYGLNGKEGIIDNGFLYYFLKNNISELKQKTHGAVFDTITRDTFEHIQISYPDLGTQKGIAKNLGSFDDKIQLNTQINQTLEQIAQALFKSWFVDFDPVRAKAQALSDGLSLEQAELAAMQAISGKTPEELTALSQAQPDRYAELAETAKAFPCEMVEVDGVKVPKGWEVKELGSLMTIKRGGSPRPIKDFISDKGLNWVKISDATAEDNPFLFSTKEYIKSEGLSKTVLLKKGSLILSNSATPGLPRFLELDACIHDGWLYFSDIKSLTQEYLYFFFLNIRNDLVAQGNGSVFTNLKTDIVKAQKAIVPDERAICYFDKQVKSIMNLIKYNTANSISLKETRDLLLPRLLNGELNG